MPTQNENIPYLSTRHINRLLRPLRSRCLSLSTLTAERVRQASNNVLSTSQLYTSLDSLPSHKPELSKTRRFVERNGAHKMQSIVDCFRAIVINTGLYAYPHRKPCNSGRLPRARIASLASICACIIGDDIGRYDVEEFGDAIDAMYDTIPLEYRRFAVISHSLTLILCSTPHIPRFLTALLELCLYHGLNHESYVLLPFLLSSTFCREASLVSAPICNPSYSDFLVGIHTRWTENGLSASNLYRESLRILDSVDKDVWACEAVQRLAKIIASEDLSSFLQLVGGLANVVLDSQRRPDLGALGSLKPPLIHWLGIALDRFPLTFTTRKPLDNETIEHYYMLHETLLSIYALNLPADSDIQSYLLSLASCYLSFPHQFQPATLVKYIVRNHTNPLSLAPIVTKAFADCGGDLTSFKVIIGNLACIFRTLHLSTPEVALLESTLHYIEDPTHERGLATQNSAASLRSYRHELIGLVEDAETRCFGLRLSHSSSASSPNHTRHPHLHDVWEWEELVGCWIRKVQDPSSSPQKRKQSQTRLAAPMHTLDVSRKGKASRGYNLDSHRTSTLQLPHKFDGFGCLLVNAQSMRSILHPIQNTSAGLSPRVHRQEAQSHRHQHRDNACPSSDDKLDLL